jgi:hypothetical protein
MRWDGKSARAVSNRGGTGAPPVPLSRCSKLPRLHAQATAPARTTVASDASELRIGPTLITRREAALVSEPLVCLV